jgi:hypothetical protein
MSQVGTTQPCRNLRVLAVISKASFLLLCVACAAGPPETTAGPAKPPPRPGSSITHSRMCACTTCPVARCCGGETDEPEARTCRDSYDFSGACGMAVQSCTGRCYQKVWRVRLDQSCEQKRPDECCAGG